MSSVYKDSSGVQAGGHRVGRPGAFQLVSSNRATSKKDFLIQDLFEIVTHI